MKKKKSNHNSCLLCEAQNTVIPMRYYTVTSGLGKELWLELYCCACDTLFRTFVKHINDVPF